MFFERKIPPKISRLNCSGFVHAAYEETSVRQLPNNNIRVSQRVRWLRGVAMFETSRWTFKYRDLWLRRTWNANYQKREWRDFASSPRFWSRERENQSFRIDCFVIELNQELRHAKESEKGNRGERGRKGTNTFYGTRDNATLKSKLGTLGHCFGHVALPSIEVPRIDSRIHNLAHWSFAQFLMSLTSLSPTEDGSPKTSSKFSIAAKFLGQFSAPLRPLIGAFTRSRRHVSLIN